MAPAWGEPPGESVWGEPPGERRWGAGELASHGHRKETNARHQCSDFVCLYNSGSDRALAAGMFPEVRKGQGSSVAFARLQTHLVSHQAGGTSLRNRLLFLWDMVLKGASVTSGSSLRPSAVPFPSTLPCGALVPGGQCTQCIHTWVVSVLGSCSGGPACLQVRQGWGGKWGRLGEAPAEKEASARGAFLRQVEEAGPLCGLESVYLGLATGNHTCHIPYTPVSVDLLLISVLEIAGPRETPDKQNFTRETTSHKRLQSGLLPAWGSVILRRRVCPLGAPRLEDGGGSWDGRSRLRWDSGTDTAPP